MIETILNFCGMIVVVCISFFGCAVFLTAGVFIFAQLGKFLKKEQNKHTEFPDTCTR